MHLERLSLPVMTRIRLDRFGLSIAHGWWYLSIGRHG